MNAEEKVEFVRRAVEPALTGGPRTLLERYDDLFTDDFRWRPLITSIEGGADYRGREGFARYCDDFEASWTAVNFRNASFRAVGDDTVLAKLHMGVEGTESGVPIEQDIGWVFHFKGDKVDVAETHLSWADAEAAAEERANATT
jgi:ketosteroid isomerase-like protein